ncbi:MAG: cache domain-containing protein [Spirochaetes bacterium]|nr:cache domain-containing protein [Spirochaetota bacterium]
MPFTVRHDPHAWLRIVLRVALPAALTIVLFLVAFFLIAIPSIEREMLESRKEAIREIVQIACSLLGDYERQVREGVLSPAEARRRAAGRIRGMRYGPEGKDYLWINDMHPRIVMHPYRSDLDGTDVSGFTDEKGARVFVKFADTVRRHGSGYVSYHWQWKDDPSRKVPKLSYVQGFAPWGWVVGTGVYTDDVRERLAAITGDVRWAFVVILFIVTSLSVYIIFQAIGREHLRHLAEKALEDSEQRLKNIIDFLPDATFAIDNEGRVITWNRAIERMTGLPASEMIGKGDLEYAIPFYGEKRPLLVDYIINWTDDFLDTYQYLKRDENRLIAEAESPVILGGGHYFLATASPLYDADGNPAGAIESLRDITERKLAEKRLAEALEEKEILLKEVHHRVKNNMQIISSLLTLQDSKSGNAELHRSFQESINRIHAMALVHNQLYQSSDFARISLGDYAGSLAGRLSDVYRADRPGVRTSVDADSVSVTINDAVPVGLILNELVTNAFKHAFSGNDGTILITLRETGDGRCSITVADDGVGMPPDEERTAGTTLGLVLIEALVRQLGARMEIARPGKGTEIRITFPLR